MCQEGFTVQVSETCSAELKAKGWEGRLRSLQKLRSLYRPRPLNPQLPTRSKKWLISAWPPTVFVHQLLKIPSFRRENPISQAQTNFSNPALKVGKTRKDWMPLASKGWGSDLGLHHTKTILKRERHFRNRKLGNSWEVAVGFGQLKTTNVYQRVHKAG